MSISYAVFCLNSTAPTQIYTLSLHDALPISSAKPMSPAIASPSRTHQWKRRLIRRMPRSSMSSLAYLRRSACPWSVNSQPMCAWNRPLSAPRSEEHTSELQSHVNLVCRLLLELYRAHPDLHSFPTRRSSDLEREADEPGHREPEQDPPVEAAVDPAHAAVLDELLGVLAALGLPVVGEQPAHVRVEQALERAEIGRAHV